ncbi:MAG: hypothetical protein KGJ77_04900 [Acidobacteriota bacterium]|nr:hypothetical protein [Acidobacteriota bacterium]
MTAPHALGAGDLDHEQLATLAKEYLLAGHLIDRAGMPHVVARGVDAMRDVAVDEWMAASPVYTTRMQRLLGFEGDTVETCFKGMQIDVGAPPEFMDFRYEVTDDHHGRFHLDHCGALMDVEPLGDKFVVAMCHHIEDPTFDATGWATNPRLRMRPVHRPPRRPADRRPHCEWSVTIDEAAEPGLAPSQAAVLGRSKAARLPLAVIATPEGAPDGLLDYAGPLDPDLQMRDFATPALVAILDEVCLQGQLLAMGFALAVERRYGPDAAVETTEKQCTGVAGVVAERLRRALALGAGTADVATVFELHPAFRPRGYVDWDVVVDGDVVRLRLGDCAATEEEGFHSWITLLASGHDRALGAVAGAVDRHWVVDAEGPRQWTVRWTEEPAEEPAEVALTKFSTGVKFGFDR